MDPSAERPCGASQEGDAESLLNLVRRLVAFRKTHPALGNGALVTQVINGKGGYPIVYQRGDSNERFVVALNPAGQPGEVEITLPGAARLVTVFADKAEASLDNDRAILRMEGVSFGIFEVHFQ